MSCLVDKNSYINDYNSLSILINNLDIYFKSNFDSGKEPIEYYQQFLILKQKFNSLPSNITTITQCCSNSKFLGIDSNNNILCGCEFNTEPYFDNDGNILCNPSYGCMNSSYDTFKIGNMTNNGLKCICSSQSKWSYRYNTCINTLNLNDINNYNNQINSIKNNISTTQNNIIITNPYITPSSKLFGEPCTRDTDCSSNYCNSYYNKCGLINPDNNCGWDTNITNNQLKCENGKFCKSGYCIQKIPSDPNKGNGIVPSIYTCYDNFNCQSDNCVKLNNLRKICVDKGITSLPA
jgi:hypothetical protein